MFAPSKIVRRQINYRNQQISAQAYLFSVLCSSIVIAGFVKNNCIFSSKSLTIYAKRRFCSVSVDEAPQH